MNRNQFRLQGSPSRTRGHAPKTSRRDIHPTSRTGSTAAISARATIRRRERRRASKGGADSWLFTPLGTIGRILSALLFFCMSGAAHAQDWKKMPSVGDTQYVVVSPTRVLDRGLYDDVIVSLCRPSTYCHIRFWSDPQMVPSGTELTNAHRAADRRAARPADPPRPHPGDERRQLPPQAEQAPPARQTGHRPTRQSIRGINQGA